MPKYKTAELTGDLLDAAVALADGRLVVADEPGWPKGDYKKLRTEYGGRHVVRWYGTAGDLGGWEPLDNQGSPSTDWNLGGPIIEREQIDVAAPDEFSDDERWFAGIYHGTARHATPRNCEMRGDTPLIAAMRAYVASKLGPVVDLPR
jgi:hypothetical protein